MSGLKPIGNSPANSVANTTDHPSPIPSSPTTATDRRIASLTPNSSVVTEMSRNSALAENLSIETNTSNMINALTSALPHPSTINIPAPVPNPIVPSVAVRRGPMHHFHPGRLLRHLQERGLSRSQPTSPRFSPSSPTSSPRPPMHSTSLNDLVILPTTPSTLSHSQSSPSFTTSHCSQFSSDPPYTEEQFSLESTFGSVGDVNLCRESSNATAIRNVEALRERLRQIDNALTEREGSHVQVRGNESVREDVPSDFSHSRFPALEPGWPHAPSHPIVFPVGDATLDASSAIHDSPSPSYPPPLTAQRQEFRNTRNTPGLWQVAEPSVNNSLGSDVSTNSNPRESEQDAVNSSDRSSDIDADTGNMRNEQVHRNMFSWIPRWFPSIGLPFLGVCSTLPPFSFTSFESEIK